MGVYSGQSASKGGANASPTVAVLFIVVIAISFCALIPVEHHNHQPVGQVHIYRASQYTLNIMFDTVNLSLMCKYPYSYHYFLMLKNNINKIRHFCPFVIQ